MERDRLLSAPATREAQQDLLLRLVKAQRETSDAERIRAIAAEAVGRYLNASVVVFAMIGEGGVPCVKGSWTTESASLANLTAGFKAALRLGGPLWVADTASELPGSGIAEAGLRALLNISVERSGVVTGGFIVGQADIRQ